MVRLFTNAGVEGLGNCRASQDLLAAMVGKSPFQNLLSTPPEMLASLGSQTMPFWDLAGKLLRKPVHALLGSREPRRVPVYDGSIYFADLLPQYEARWQDRFREEIDMGLQAGHRAFKIKIGRGNKWMERTAGDARDVEVVATVRRHAGKDVLLGVDANNGFDLERAKRFIAQAGGLDLAWIEEPFPEEVGACLELKRFMAAHGWKTLLADGETQRDLAVFEPFVKAKAIDVFQADMNAFGIEGILREAAMTRPQGLLIAPHNWGSLVGFYEQVHVGRAISNFYRAEHDPLSSNVLIAEGYKITDGTCSVPGEPGFGLAIDDGKFHTLKPRFDLKA